MKKIKIKQSSMVTIIKIILNKCINDILHVAIITNGQMRGGWEGGEKLLVNINFIMVQKP